MEEVLQKPWWTTLDVAVYLYPGNPNQQRAQIWMWRNKVRRSKAHIRFTCREWVDAVLNRRR